MHVDKFQVVPMAEAKFSHQDRVGPVVVFFKPQHMPELRIEPACDSQRCVLGGVSDRPLRTGRYVPDETGVEILPEVLLPPLRVDDRVRYCHGLEVSEPCPLVPDVLRDILDSLSGAKPQLLYHYAHRVSLNHVVHRQPAKRGDDPGWLPFPAKVRDVVPDHLSVNHVQKRDGPGYPGVDPDMHDAVMS